MDFATIKNLLAKAKELSTAKKVIMVVLISLAAVFCVTSCTSMRSMSVSVDKAENVSINLKDSINGEIPFM